MPTGSFSCPGGNGPTKTQTWLHFGPLYGPDDNPLGGIQIGGDGGKAGEHPIEEIPNPFDPRGKNKFGFGFWIVFEH